MNTELNTSLRAGAELPHERAVLPIINDLVSEYAAIFGAEVTIHTPMHNDKIRSAIQGVLEEVVKGLNGELLLTVSERGGMRFVPQGKGISHKYYWDTEGK